MPANIFGQRFLGRRQPAWHGLGQVFEEPLTASEALARSKVNCRMSKEPLCVFMGETIVPLQDHQAIVRDKTTDDPEYRIFGIVSPDYELLQNAKIARILDPLTDEWPVETVGALGYGETVFLTLDAGRGEIAGDEIRQFFLVTDSHSGHASLQIAFTPVRVVCQNTLVSGLAQATVKVSLPHLVSIRDDLSNATTLFQQIRLSQDTMLKLFTELSQRKVSLPAVRGIIRHAYPLPRKLRPMSPDGGGAPHGQEKLDWEGEADMEWAPACELVERRREDAMWLFRRLCDQSPRIAMTPWAAYNAVVEIEDYRKGPPTAGVYRSALFGERASAKVRALEAACALLN